MKDFSSSRPNGRTDKQGVPAIGKAVRILEEIVSAPVGLGVSEVARRTGLSKSTVHALMVAMADEGLLTGTETGKTYTTGARLIALASGSNYARFLALAQSALALMTAHTGETALMGSRSGDGVTVLAAHNGTRSLSVSAPVGSSVPLMAGALGKAYLASLPLESRSAFLDDHPLPRHTDRSLTDVSTYLAEVQRVAREGYALDRGEYLSGIVAAASTFRWIGVTYFVWTVGIESDRDQDLLDMGRACRDAALAMARQLDGNPPHLQESA